MRYGFKCFQYSYPNVQEGIQWFYYRENYTFRIQRGSNLFQWGGPNTYCYRTPYNLWFSGEGGGGPDPLSPYGSAQNTEAVILIETGVWICGQTDKTYKHEHLQTGRLKEHSCACSDRQTYRNINIHVLVLTDRQAVGQTEKYIHAKYDNELKFNWWRTMHFDCSGHYVRLVKMYYETVGIIIDLLWP